MISFWHVAIVAVVALLLFGKGKASSFLSDLGKGIKDFRKNIKDDV